MTIGPMPAAVSRITEWYPAAASRRPAQSHSRSFSSREAMRATPLAEGNRLTPPSTGTMQSAGFTRRSTTPSRSR